jgi:prepilin-type N-terminal cleavage/methylation domain-containing protein
MIIVNKNPRIHPQSGFTLLELLIAITLLAIMAVGIWALLSLSIRSWTRGTEAIDINQRHRSVLYLAAKQIASIYPLYTTSTNIEQNSVSSLIFKGTENSFLFISLNSLQFFDNFGLMLVSYGMDRDASGHAILAEKEARYIGQVPDESALNSSEPISVFDDISSCSFEYYDPGDAENPARWVNEWDGSALNRLPSAVRMTMIAQDSQAGTLNRQLIIPFHAKINLVGSIFSNSNNQRIPAVRN